MYFEVQNGWNLNRPYDPYISQNLSNATKKQPVWKSR